MSEIEPVKWQNDQLLLLDQRILPAKEEYMALNTLKDCADAISDMVVRGAPAIGITAAYAIALGVREHYQKTPHDWYRALLQELEYLACSRPTAVNLFWAIDKARALLQPLQQSQEDPFLPMLQLAQSIHQQDIDDNKKMAALGAELIAQSLSASAMQQCQVLTHCNAGALATGGYGTALGVIRCAFSRQLIAHVYADETRPWLQGARLTAWEMVKEKIPVSLLVEGAASHLMQQQKHADIPLKWIIVGSDRIAANGDVANKIGTFGLAVLARYHGLKFMVVAPTSTIDWQTRNGEDIPIEQRDGREVLYCSGQPVAAAGARAMNPAFDVTPAHLVDAIVTEKGVVLQPDSKKMQVLRQS